MGTDEVKVTAMNTYKYKEGQSNSLPVVSDVDFPSLIIAIEFFTFLYTLLIFTFILYIFLIHYFCHSSL